MKSALTRHSNTAGAIRGAALIGLVAAIAAAGAVALGASFAGVPHSERLGLYCVSAGAVGFFIGAGGTVALYYRTGVAIESVSQAARELWHAFGRTQF